MEGAASFSITAVGAMGATSAIGARVVMGADGMAGDAGDAGDASLPWANTPDFRLKAHAMKLVISILALNRERIHVLQMPFLLHSRTACKDPLAFGELLDEKPWHGWCFFCRLLRLVASARPFVLLVCVQFSDQILTLSNCRMFLRLARQRSANLVHVRAAAK